ncbi:hypothetical protein [Bacteroides sp.]|uniref:hypothetical protein n=1 Tax=Bacteroides sp. TaxID=29523 RepID=UPI00258D6031|nr:hypothetical protein [Bacteroides sp.]
MTFRDFMRENGYDVVTTFWEDFSAADIYGIPAVTDTFNRGFEEWKGNHIYLTELVLVLNHKIWQHHESSPALAGKYTCSKHNQYSYCRFHVCNYFRFNLFQQNSSTIPLWHLSLR